MDIAPGEYLISTPENEWDRYVSYMSIEEWLTDERQAPDEYRLWLARIGDRSYRALLSENRIYVQSNQHNLVPEPFLLDAFYLNSLLEEKAPTDLRDSIGVAPSDITVDDQGKIQPPVERLEDSDAKSPKDELDRLLKSGFELVELTNDADLPPGWEWGS